MASLSGFGNTVPKFPRAPTAPAGPSMFRGGKGVTLAPLKGPAIKLPGDQQKALTERWNAWRSRREGSGTGSILEFIVWEYLTKTKKLVPDVDFIYQYPLMGGRTQLGGFVADFYFPVRRMVWNPAGLYFHQTKPEDRARDLLAKTMLAGRGVKVIYLYEDDLLNRPTYTMNRAWEGSEISK